jgi:hypothetical protein
MKKKLVFISAALLVMTLCSVRSAMAIGIGAYVDGAYNSFSASGEGGTASIGDYGFVGAGFVLDTCVARNDVFNYRMGLGYQKDVKYTQFDTHKISMNNYFGFGIVRLKSFRWWLGPQLGLRCYIFGSDKGASSAEGGGNIGVVTGFNFNIGSVFTIGLELGFRYNFLFRSPLIHGPEGHGAIVFLFRVNDTY